MERGNWEECDEDEAFIKGGFIWKPVHLIDNVSPIYISSTEDFDKEIEMHLSLSFITILIPSEEFLQNRVL